MMNSDPEARRLSRQLSDETHAYQLYIELRRDHSEQFDDEQLGLLEENVGRAHRSMEVAWLDTMAAAK